MKFNEFTEEVARFTVAALIIAIMVAWVLSAGCVHWPDRATVQYHEGWRGDEKVSFGLEFPITYRPTFVPEYVAEPAPEPVPEPAPEPEPEAAPWTDPAWIISITGLISAILGVIYRKEVAAGVQSVKKTLTGSGEKAPRP